MPKSCTRRSGQRRLQAPAERVPVAHPDPEGIGVPEHDDARALHGVIEGAFAADAVRGRAVGDVELVALVDKRKARTHRPPQGRVDAQEVVRRQVIRHLARRVARPRTKCLDAAERQLAHRDPEKRHRAENLQGRETAARTRLALRP